MTYARPAPILRFRSHPPFGPAGHSYPGNTGPGLIVHLDGGSVTSPHTDMVLIPPDQRREVTNNPRVLP